MAQSVHQSFAPVVTPETRLLLCGSLPGAASLAARRYYAHPRNQFWRLAGDLIERDIAALDYPVRLAALNEAGVGLWDAVARARRAGSLDSAIRLEAPNALAKLAARLPDLRAIAFNGGTAARIGRAALGADFVLPLEVLPSSSPAFTRPYAEKAAAWIALRRYL